LKYHLASISIHISYLALPSKSLPIPYVIVNLSNIHQNITFTSEKIYFLDGVAYDYYSIDELNNRSRAGLQWKTFPLPNEQIPANITPWMPKYHLRKTVYTSIPSEASTGLAFVDHIYITSILNLTDRQANLEKIFARYQITNYEWRLKWTRETCNAPENKEEVHKKLNLWGKEPLSIRLDLFFSHDFSINYAYFRETKGATSMFTNNETY
jgi:hypothetical protein